MDFLKHVNEIEEKIGYRFKDRSLLMQAFTRTSFCNEHKAPNGEGYQSNEVLEFFGDSVLSLAIVTLIIKDCSKRYGYGIKTKLAEGDFSNIKSRLSDKKNLSDRMRELGLAAYLQMGEGDAKLSIEKEPSVMEDLFESIIGAIYIDSDMNMDAVIKSVSRMLSVKDYMQSIMQPPIQSHKNALQEWCADKKRRLPPPVYKTISESGPEHKKCYEQGCFIGERLYATGIGKNRKLAEASAAEKALKVLMEEEMKKKAPKPDGAAVQKLIEYLRSVKETAPSFVDMGEDESSTPELPKYRVACKAMGFSSIGNGLSKSDARIDSASKMLKLIKGKSDGKKAPAKENSKTHTLRKNKRNTR